MPQPRSAARLCTSYPMPEFAHKAKFEDCVAVRESGTGLALLVEIDGEERWVPHSQIDDDSEVFKVGDKGILVLNEWWAEQKGLI